MSQPLILLLKCICCGKRLFGTSMLVLLCLMVGETANAGNYGCIKLSTTYFNLDDGSRYTAVLLDGLADGSLATLISVDCKDTYTLEKSLLEDNTSYESVVDGVTRRQIPLITLPDQVNANRRWFPGNLAVAWRTTTIAWMNADGTNRHEIVKDADIVPIAINGDTMLFAVTPTIPPQTSDLYLANLKTGEDQLVLKGIGDSNSLKVAWSADRSLFAIYPSTLDPGNGALDVFTHNGKPLRHFDQLPAISDAGQTLTWLPSCRKAR